MHTLIICFVHLLFVQIYIVLTENSKSAAIDLIQNSQSIVLEAEKNPKFINICNSWLFAAIAEDFEEFESFSILRPPGYRAFVIYKIPNQEKHANLTPREFEEEELKNPSRLGHTWRFTPNCVVAFIAAAAGSKTSSTISSLAIITNTLTMDRILRPHKDLFVHMHRHRHNFDPPPGQIHLVRHNLEVYGSNLTSESEVKRFFGRKTKSFVSGQHMRISVTADPTKLRFQNHPNGTLAWARGTYYQMITESGRRLNFTFNLQRSFKGFTGIKLEGIWQGALGEVFRNEVDFAVIIGMTAQRIRIIDPTVAVNRYIRIFYITTPLPSRNWKAILRPFHPLVWLLLWTSGLSFLALLIFTFPKGGKLGSRVSQVTGAILKILLEQGSSLVNSNHVRMRTKFLLLLWILAAMIFGTLYRSNLVTFLTFGKINEFPPRTHKELILSDYKLYFRYWGGLAYNYIVQSNETLHKRMREKMILVNSSADCVISALLTEKSACLEYGVPGDYAVATNTSLFAQRDDAKLFTKSADSDIWASTIWAFRKGSPLTESFDKMILTFAASGLHSHWIAQDLSDSRKTGANWLAEQKDSPVRKRLIQLVEDSSGAVKPLSRENFFGINAIIFIGAVLSLLMLIGEIIYFRARRKCAAKAKAAENVETIVVAPETIYAEQDHEEQAYPAAARTLCSIEEAPEENQTNT